MIIHYTSICITGIEFDYSNGPSASIGFDGTNETSLDLSRNKRLDSLSSYCDVVCNSFTLCSRDTVTQTKTCIDVGNLMTVNLNKYHSISLDQSSIYSFFGTLTSLNGLVCISNLGIIGLQYWPSENLNTMNLARIPTKIAEANSSFSINIDQTELTSLVLKYDDYCTNGFDFVYKNGSIQSLGFNGTWSVSLDLSGSNKLFSVETRNKLEDEFFYFVRLCSYNSNSTNMFETLCVDNRKSSLNYGLKKFITINSPNSDLQIKSFYGETIQKNDGHVCIRNFGINFLFENRFRIPSKNETIGMCSFYLI
jgi:hypothetical protein